ncbi:hypothetical protein ACOZ4N_07120 [Halorientalis pallida]|uniref:hypothetical protein n=1 Tax=Halorientalis pallida TaxID=2479928 RepID=UPI003C6F652E
MIGTHRFCPESGAALSRERHYDGDGRPWRAVDPDDESGPTETVGALTNGAVRSSRKALIVYYERCRERHRDADDDAVRRASLAIRRLKSAATGRQEWDVHVWFALARRLDRYGYDSAWMNGYAAPRCPFCHGRLQYRTVGDTVTAQCATNCADRGLDCLAEIRDLVADLYTVAFPDPNPPAAETYLQL